MMLGEKIDKGERSRRSRRDDDEKTEDATIVSHEERYIDHQASIEATSMNHDGETDDASHLQKEKERDEKELNGALTMTTRNAINAICDEEKERYNYWLDRDLDPALGQIAWRAMPGDAFILRAQKRAKENPGNLNFQEEFTKAMEIEFPDAEKKAMHPLCASPPEKI